jgi:hypothetical protein
MIKLATCALAAALLTGEARAQQPNPAETAAMHDFWGAALEISVPWESGGGTSVITRYYAPDHTYRETNEVGEAHGRWSVEGGKICATRADPPPGVVARYCNIGVGKKLGDKWQDTDPVTGNAVFFWLQPAPKA